MSNPIEDALAEIEAAAGRIAGLEARRREAAAERNRAQERELNLRNEIDRERRHVSDLTTKLIGFQITP